ncbi:MAG: nucleoside 2-deoxyribosyltransferase [Candidatus Binatus sp.]|uniref:nucleoside 2-deoxyribosyltransferase n=1 Tax=Candidatus Binatus sp. TaxID=2811406 RepID=UPI002721C27A|nr:nucleoside 2-deoxyribosyltransferase [Candidatus Binatus sp.]MDO8432843.1 nucleoside 2-deoxyribosyltransferase [Candidatus Binatus sp.]
MRALLKIYLAGPLFTIAERRFNRELTREIGAALPRCEVILPQLRAGKYIVDGKMDFDAIVRDCIEQIDHADAVIAMLDGSDSDSGTAWECGYAHARDKPIIGVRTDLRGSEDDGLNAMLRRTCRVVIAFPATREKIRPLAREIVGAISRVFETKTH